MGFHTGLTRPLLLPRVPAGDTGAAGIAGPPNRGDTVSPEILEKVKKLPLWAREFVREQQIRAEPQTEELARLRKENEKFQQIIRRQNDRIEAMVQFFQCAAKGGNEVAAAVERIVEDYIVSDEE